MNEFTDLSIYQDNYQWFVDGIVSNASIPFADGMTIQLGGATN